LDFQDSKLKEGDGGKKMKKQPVVSTAAVLAAKTSATENKAAVEHANSLAVIDTASVEIIGTAPEIIDTSEAIGTLAGEDQEKKDPPLT
jgi:hypothetical protein